MSGIYLQTPDGGWESIGHLATPLEVTFTGHGAVARPYVHPGWYLVNRTFTTTMPISREVVALLFPELLQMWADEAAVAVWENEGGR